MSPPPARYASIIALGAQAVGALQEAVKCFERSKDTQRMEEFQRRMELITHFVTVQNLPKDDLEGITRACQGLLSEPHINVGGEGVAPCWRC